MARSSSSSAVVLAGLLVASSLCLRAAAADGHTGPAAPKPGSGTAAGPLSCAAMPIVKGQRGGGDYRNFAQPSGANASACRAACCADGSCAFWGLDVKLPPPSRKSCTAGQACCWLKGAKASGVGPPCAWGCYTGASGRAPPAPPPAPPPPPSFNCRADEDCALAGKFASNPPIAWRQALSGPMLADSLWSQAPVAFRAHARASRGSVSSQECCRLLVIHTTVLRDCLCSCVCSLA